MTRLWATEPIYLFSNLRTQGTRLFYVGMGVVASVFSAICMVIRDLWRWGVQIPASRTCQLPKSSRQHNVQDRGNENRNEERVCFLVFSFSRDPDFRRKYHA